jgi:DNA (cytosine-5)-methyltransferase 1
MLTLTDLFCGAGGSSTGAIAAPGVEVRVASNHWQLAVETHNTNHPDADHICADLSQIHPRYFPTSDILWASPECTNHSRAKGRPADTAQGQLWGEALPDEAAERSRATMWDVVRFSEHHRYAAVIVENVVEVAQWLPFRAWLAAMDSLGYTHRLVSLNSMHAQTHGLPAPQSRDRLYIVFWLKGNRTPDLDEMQRPLAWCDACTEVVRARQWWKRDRGPDQVGRYRSQYLYRCPNTACRHAIVEPAWLPAYTAIDWTIPGQRIGDRAKPLADKTRARIAAGIARYWSPIHLEAAGHTYDAADPKHPQHGDPNSYYRAWPVDDVLKTLHTIESKALAVPVEGRDGKFATPTGAAFRTQTTRLETGLAMPFIAELRGGGSTARPTTETLATLTAGGNHHGLVVPAGGTWNEDARSTDDALRALTTRDAYALAVPYYGTAETARPVDEPIGTLTTRDRYALVMRNNGGGAEMTTPAWESLRTLTTAGHQSILTPGDIAAAAAQVDDVMFRMLEPSEAKRGMAFPSDYVILGNRREQVRMAGNAVTPPAARDLVACVAEALGGAA